MPPQQARSGLLDKYGNRLDAAVKKHAGDETDYGFQRLPGGINGGIARLVECKFDVVAPGKQNAGEVYFRAAGVVIEPEFAPNGERVRGRQTSIMEMVCDTKNREGKVTTVDDHVQSILNEMRKLGGPSFTEGASGSDLESLAAQLKELAPYFRFSTSAGTATKEYPTPRIFENWHGAKGLEEYTPPEEGGGVDDNTSGGPVPPPSNNGAETTEEPPPAMDEDLDALAVEAETSEDAQRALQERATAAGIEDDALVAAESWAAVVDMIRAAEGGGEAPAAEETPWEPAKTDVYHYYPVVVDGKTKKQVKAKKPVEVEVTTVDKAKRLVSLKNIDNPKVIYKSVSWDDLESVSS